MGKIDDMSMAINAYRRLLPTERKLHKLGEQLCNGEVSDAYYDKQVAALLKEAQVPTNWTGLKLYHQTDPRGCALYLIDDTMDETTYNNGIAICK